jgi:CRISPR-associated protein Cas1
VKKLLNTLYITSPEAYLGLDGECVSVSVGGKEKRKLPLIGLESIVSFGRTGASPAFMHKCAQTGVGLSFCSEYGKYLASVEGEIRGSVLLRRKQFRIAEDAEKSLAISRSFIIGKISNSRNVLLRALRDHGDSSDSPAMRAASERLGRYLKEAATAESTASLMGVEGEAARTYFDVFDGLIVARKPDFKFDGRNRRPPRDNVNALLSFSYAMLAIDVKNALSSVGLDPFVGFFHSERPGRASLALDVMEELRSALADRMVLSLINNRQVTKRDFEYKDDGSVLLGPDGKKKVLEAMHNRKKEEITHPFLDEKIQWGLVPYAQAMLLARHIRGDIDAYPPFVLK